MDFDFVGAEYQAASPTQDAQQCINWYPETDPTKFAGSPATGVAKERGVMALYPTPGIVSAAQLVAAEVRGVHVLPGNTQMLAVSGSSLYLISANFIPTVVGTLLSSSGPVSITDNDVSAYITDGTNRYSYNWGTNTFAIITDGAFNGADVCDVIDNFIIYNRPGTNQYGCTNAGSTVSNPLNLGSLVGSSGNIVSVIADHSQVLVLGEWFSERHQNVGTFPWPFARIAGSAIQHGLAAVHSPARLGEGIAFLAQDTRGKVTVVMWGAAITVPQRISSFAIENAIQQYAVTSDAIGYTYNQAGHEFYVLTFPTEDITWVYDLASGLWHRRAWRDSMNVYHRHRSNCGTLFGEDFVVGDWQNGKLYTLSQTEFSDDGAPLPCVRRCKHLTNDLKRIFYSDLQIQFQPGVGLQAGQGSDPECVLRMSRDGGRTWGNDHILKIGKVGQYTRRAIKRRLGYARDAVFEVTVTDPVYRVVISANLNASVGAS